MTRSSSVAAGQVLAVEDDAPARRQHAHQRGQRGRLAGAVGADHADHLAFGEPVSTRQAAGMQHLGAP
jgi:hypothetical protein